MENNSTDGPSSSSDLANFLANFDAAENVSSTATNGETRNPPTTDVHRQLVSDVNTSGDLRELLDQLGGADEETADRNTMRIVHMDANQSLNEEREYPPARGSTFSERAPAGEDRCQPDPSTTNIVIDSRQQQLIIPIDAGTLQTQADGTQTVLLPIVPTLMPDGRIEMRIAGSNIPIALSSDQQAQLVIESTGQATHSGQPALVKQEGAALTDTSSSSVLSVPAPFLIETAVEEATQSEIDMELLRIVRNKRRPTAASSSVGAEKPMYKCQYCDYCNDRPYLLVRHMKSHSENRPFKCTECERSFKTNSSLNNHLNTHTGKKSYVCGDCSAAFTTSGELLRHQRYRHTMERPHRCPHCDYATVELSKLKRHIRSHTGEKPFKCELCEYSSVDQYKMKRHQRTHTGDRPYECDICLQRFTQSNTLKTHRLTHEPQEQRPVFKCEFCPATCGRRTDLRIHVNAQHSATARPIRCVKCAATFPDRYTFKQHWRAHKGQKCFRCPHCEYEVGIKRLLDQHLMVHSDDKPFHCTAVGCARRFKQEGQLRRHYNLRHDPLYRIKSAEKRNVCEICGRMFRHAGNLLRHVELHKQQGAEVEITEFEDVYADEHDEADEYTSARTSRAVNETTATTSLNDKSTSDDNVVATTRKPTVRLFAFSKEPMPVLSAAVSKRRNKTGTLYHHRNMMMKQQPQQPATRRRRARPEDFGMTNIKKVGIGRPRRTPKPKPKLPDDGIFDVHTATALKAEERRKALENKFGFADFTLTNGGVDLNLSNGNTSSDPIVDEVSVAADAPLQQLDGDGFPVV